MTSSSEAITEIGTKRAEIKEQYKKFIGRKIIFILSCITVIFLIAGISTTLGSYPITVSEVYSIIFHGLFQDVSNTTEGIIVWKLRLPRIVMGVLAGIGLAIAGTAMQGILRNPLASPTTIGIAAGAQLGAGLAFIIGVGFFGGKFLLIGNAFLFSLIPAGVIFALARFKKATPEMMILAGIAMGYIFAAVTSLLHYFSEAEALKDLVVWMMGDLGRVTWSDLSAVSLTIGVCIPLLIWKSWDLNVMGAGDETAKGLGVNVERDRIVVMIIASLLTAVIVCFTGLIGFIGLVAPHITRICIGGDNRFVIPASGLFGAAFLLGADTIARRIIAPVILPVGIITSCVGGPLFLYLIMRKRKEYW
jgi:iron complex transport system permease protein